MEAHAVIVPERSESATETNLSTLTEALWRGGNSTGGRHTRGVYSGSMLGEYAWGVYLGGTLDLRYPSVVPPSTLPECTPQVNTIVKKPLIADPTSQSNCGDWY